MSAVYGISQGHCERYKQIVLDYYSMIKLTCLSIDLVELHWQSWQGSLMAPREGLRAQTYFTFFVLFPSWVTNFMLKKIGFSE